MPIYISNLLHTPRISNSVGATSPAVNRFNTARSLSDTLSSMPADIFTATKPITPDFWFEKNILWHLPELFPSGAMDIQSIQGLEAARNYFPIDNSTYALLPVDFHDLPIFEGAEPEYGDPAQPRVAAYHVWATVGVLHILRQCLTQLNFGVDGYSLQGQWGIYDTSSMGPVVTSLILSSTYVETPNGTTRIKPVYSYVTPGITSDFYR